MSFSFKKLFTASSFALATLPVSTAYAELLDAHNHLDFNIDIRAAANALVDAVKEDKNGNHEPIPGRKAYKSLQLVSVEPEYEAWLEIDDTTQLAKNFRLDKVTFTATGIPLFKDLQYKATIKLSVALTPECEIVKGSRKYEIVESNKETVDKLLKRDLTGLEYNKLAYGDVVFTKLLESDGLKQFCKPHAYYN